jgi:hypothetical protein
MNGLVGLALLELTIPTAKLSIDVWFAGTGYSDIV